MFGKMKEKSWSLKGGKDATENQNRRQKKDRTHVLIAKKLRFNKKKKRWELTKKHSKEIVSVRCD